MSTAFETYQLAHSSFDEREKRAMYEVIESGRFTMGPKVKEFEDNIADFHGVKNAVMVNSGSSANLLMVGAMIETGKLKAGDDVIVPAVGWSTSYLPFHQYGIRMSFVDVDPYTWNIDCNRVIDAITDRTKAILAINVLGAPCDFTRLQDICDEYGLLLLEDNCESFGARWDGKMTGTFGMCGTLSFFFSHHLQTMEGGMILTQNDAMADAMRSMRAHGWSRGVYDDKKFNFVHPGYSVRPLEMSGAIGLIQLDKWQAFYEQRVFNSKHFEKHFGFETWCRMQLRAPIFSKPTWFGLGMVLCGALAGRRDEICDHLDANGIETRPIIAGNFLRQPVMKRIDHLPCVAPYADSIHNNGFYVGNDNRDLSTPIAKMRELIDGIR